MQVAAATCSRNADKDYKELALKDVCAQKFPRTDFFKLATQKGNDILLPKRPKNGRLPTSFWRKHARKNTLKSEKSGFVN